MFAQILLVGENVCFKKSFWWILPKRKRGSEPGSQGVRENILTVRGFGSTGLETSLSLSLSPSLSLRFKINHWGCSREKAVGERNFKKKSGQKGGKKKKKGRVWERDRGDGRGERREQAPRHKEFSRAWSFGSVWQMQAGPGSSSPGSDVSLGYLSPSDNSHHLWSLHRVLVWGGVPVRVAWHVAVGGHTDALGRGGNVPHRRHRRRARRQGRGARERVALVRVTALLQQFLELRAFVLKPYLHLERNNSDR